MRAVREATRIVTMLGGGAVAWPIATRAQDRKLPTIGFLGASTLSSWSIWMRPFVQRMRELGWIEGRTVVIEYRWAEGRNERYPEIAAEFRLKVDVIVTVGRRSRPQNRSPRLSRSYSR